MKYYVSFRNTTQFINIKFNFLSIFWLCYYSGPIFFSLFSLSALHPSSLQHSPPLIHVQGSKHKFFGFSFSYTIVNLPLSILCLPFMLLIPCTFIPHSPLPTYNPPCDLHFCDSVLVICLVCFCYLDSVVDSCEFVVILLFIVLIFFFLDKPL